MAEAARILRDVADALAYAHARGVVHRDIKPDNVMLSGRHALVTDFGVAKAVSEATGRQQLTTVGVALGTPAYMAPEQAAADPLLDHRVDIYALGTMAYELLTGRTPFTSPTAQGMLAAHLTEAPDLVTKHRATVPPVLAQLVMKCLQKQPADRWQRAEELVPQLESLTAPVGAAPAARPPGKRSRRLAVTAAGVVVLAALVAVSLVVRSGRPDANPAAKVPRLVVLPFDNLGPPDDEYFADGMTEEITNRLARLSGLEVIARTSAIQYTHTTKLPQQIGNELGVQYLLEGTVRWEKLSDGTSRVRISPQLIRVAGATHVWAEPYEAPLVAASVFQLQADIAEHVAQAMNVTLLDGVRLARPPTVDAEAYNLYLLGRYHFGRGTPAEWRRSIGYYEQALQRDSAFALAFVGLADARAFLAYLGRERPLDVFPAARAAVLKAIALDSTLGEAHASLGLILAGYDRDFTQAETEFRKALALSPNSVYAHLWYAFFVLSPLARHDESITLLKRAVELDPVSLEVHNRLGFANFMARRYDAAIAEYRRALDLDPSFSMAHSGLGWVFSAMGRHEEAISEIRQSQVDSTVTSDAVLAFMYARAGRRDESLTMLHALQDRERRGQYVIPEDYALLYEGLGDYDQALRWRRKAFEERSPLQVAWVGEPEQTPMGRDPRWAAMLREFGFRK